MKKLIIIYMLAVSSFVSAQEQTSNSMFSSLNYGLQVGINFNTIPTIGGFSLLGVKNTFFLTVNLFLSTGYSKVYDETDYSTKSYIIMTVNNETTYRTKLLYIDKVIYSVVPVYLGMEYFPISSKYSPFVACMVGYNFSSAEAEGASYIGASGIVNSYDELPTEYKSKAPKLEDGSSFCAAIGIGMKYSLTSRMDISLRYIYQYNDSIANTNQILLGISF
jgi:hypothetical protein